jgi:hypothetical protein
MLKRWVKKSYRSSVWPIILGLIAGVGVGLGLSVSTGLGRIRSALQLLQKISASVYVRRGLNLVVKKLGNRNKSECREL